METNENASNKAAETPAPSGPAASGAHRRVPTRVETERARARKKRIILKVIICAVCVAIIAAAVVVGALYANGTIRYTKPAHSMGGKYVFTYFRSDDEAIHMAVSEDGYNYTALFNGEAVIAQTTGTSGVNAPFVLRGRDGYFYLVAADVKSIDEYTSNHALMTWRSPDLITWSDETNIDVRNFSGFETCNSASAPFAIWDDAAGKYLVCFSVKTAAEGTGRAQIVYCHTADFTKFTAPKQLFSLENASVTDPDIVYNSKEKKYYLFYKNEAEQHVEYVVSSSLTGPYATVPEVIAFEKNVGGSSLFNITGTSSWVLALESSKKGGFVAAQTETFTHYTKLRSSAFKLPDGACQGSFLPVTDAEYERLLAAYGTDTESSNRIITPFSTTEPSAG